MRTPAQSFSRLQTLQLPHLRFLLDEQRHELTDEPSGQWFRFFSGPGGLGPRLPRLRLNLSAGPPGQMLTKRHSQMTYRSGWGGMPVIWWFQATTPASCAPGVDSPPLRAGRPAALGGCCIHSVLCPELGIWSPSSARWPAPPFWCSLASPPVWGAGGFLSGRWAASRPFGDASAVSVTLNCWKCRPRQHTLS